MLLRTVFALSPIVAICWRNSRDASQLKQQLEETKAAKSSPAQAEQIQSIEAALNLLQSTGFVPPGPVSFWQL
jgi:hypothetical protein